MVVVSKSTPMKFHMNVKHELNKDNINSHANMDRESSGGINPSNRTTISKGILRAGGGKIFFPREELINWLSKRSSLKSYR